MEKTLWDFWSERYEKLWAQRYSLGPGRDLVLDHVHRIPPPKRILDLGCGVGQLALELALRHPQAKVVGLDTSAGMIDRARADRQAPNLGFHLGPLEELAPAEPFDLVVSTHAFPYFPDKPGAIRHLHGILKPGGRVLVLHANTENPYDALWLVFVKLTTTRADYLSVARLQALLVGAGFVAGAVRRVSTAAWVPSIHLVEGIKP